MGSYARREWGLLWQKIAQPGPDSFTRAQAEDRARRLAAGFGCALADFEVLRAGAAEATPVPGPPYPVWVCQQCGQAWNLATEVPPERQMEECECGGNIVPPEVLP